MNPEDRAHELTAFDVLRRYRDEGLGEFCDVNQCGSDGDGPLHVACYRGIFEEANALVEAGADVNAPGDMGKTPLHAAAAADLFCGRRMVSNMGNPLIVELLLSNGASVDAMDEFGRTPLDVASQHKKNDVVKLLQKWMQHNKHSGSDADPTNAGDNNEDGAG